MRVEYFINSSIFAENCRALIDTGAVDSGISAGVARKMGIVSRVTREKQTASHQSVPMFVHDVLIDVPLVDSFRVPDAYEFPGLKGIDVIIGMDIIMQTDCVIRSRGKVIEMSLPREGFRRRLIRL